MAVKLLQICHYYLHKQTTEGNTVVLYKMCFILVAVHNTGLQANGVGWVLTIARIMPNNFLLSGMKSTYFGVAIRAGDLNVSLLTQVRN